MSNLKSKIERLEKNLLVKERSILTESHKRLDNSLANLTDSEKKEVRELLRKNGGLKGWSNISQKDEERLKEILEAGYKRYKDKK